MAPWKVQRMRGPLLGVPPTRGEGALADGDVGGMAELLSMLGCRTADCDGDTSLRAGMDGEVQGG